MPAGLPYGVRAQTPVVIPIFLLKRVDAATDDFGRVLVIWRFGMSTEGYHRGLVSDKDHRER